MTERRQPPAVIVVAGDGRIRGAILAGIEEEGVPAFAVSGPADFRLPEYAAVLAGQSNLAVAVAVDADGRVCLHHAKRRPGQPVYLSKQGADTHIARIIGHNAARIVTGIPLIEIPWTEGKSMSKITHEQAQAAIAAGVKAAERIGQPMNIAVVDDGGHLVAFVRMDGAIKASIDISQRKARTAVMMNLPTSALSEVTQPGQELYGLELTSGGLVTFGGGVLIHRDGEVIGAVGVSAGSVKQDELVAESAASALG